MIRVSRDGGTGKRARLTVRHLISQAHAGIDMRLAGEAEWGDVIGDYSESLRTAKKTFLRAITHDQEWVGGQRRKRGRS